MRASTLFAALLPSITLAEQVTIKVTSTSTGTITNIFTATLTKSNTRTSAFAYATGYAHSNATTKASTKASTKEITYTSATSAAPVQVTTNAAPRGAIDIALAGIAGAALYIVL